MDVERWSAFAVGPDGGNPAGVAVAADGEVVKESAMQRIAAEVGYSETAFLSPLGRDEHRVRYFAPAAEVAFCGHATIAAGVALATRDPSLSRVVLRTALAGDVLVDLSRVDDRVSARLTSPPTSTSPLDERDLDAVLDLLSWSRTDLDPEVPTAVANAGNDHPVVAVRSRDVLARMAYPFDELRTLMAARGWTTLQLVHRTDDDRLESRNPFPVGGVVEDPATGAAAAALGALLREHDLLPPSGRVTVSQGVDMGRPSVLHVDARGSVGDPVRVSGVALPILDDS